MIFSENWQHRGRSLRAMTTLFIISPHCMHSHIRPIAIDGSIHRIRQVASVRAFT